MFGVAARPWTLRSGGQRVTHWEWVASVCLGDFTLLIQALQECPTVRPVGSCSNWPAVPPLAHLEASCLKTLPFTILLSLCSCLQLSPRRTAQTPWLILDVRPSPCRHRKNNFSLAAQWESVRTRRLRLTYRWEMLRLGLSYWSESGYTTFMWLFVNAFTPQLAWCDHEIQVF